ncbi:winged helix-turn-helix transcriptional regulator [Streptomyces polygonati]|uniref:Winged helix-turn-helix transcriptional regulator n=1 Tax=Streptomyces polygonati TaxID=1617087 RepID=A0ABV8HYG2_9ACTN
MKAMELTANRYCSIAHSLETLGQKWSLLIMREAMWGRTRFAEFRAIGAPTDILTARLDSLVEEGLLERRPYRDPGARARDEYVLTEAGRDLLPVLAAFVDWGDQYRPMERGPAAVFVDESTGRPVTLSFADESGAVIERGRVRMVPGPGAPEADG